MKKTITILLLTALCMTVLTSCDLGNGLIAELFGEMNGQDVLEEPPVQNWETVYVEDLTGTIQTWVPVETDPPVEFATEDITLEEITIEEYWTEDVSIDIEPAPLPDVEYQLDLTLDGDLSDWKYASGLVQSFDAGNLDAWLGEVGDKGFDLYMAADPTYVYFALDVYDPEVFYSDDGAYNGDAFEIQMDLNGWCAATGMFERGIFYSFGLQDDETIDVTVQCMYSDAAASIDYQMASDDAPEWREGEIKGMTKKKDDGTGWIAEFAISIETLYRDVVTKIEQEGMQVPELGNAVEYMRLYMLVCYLDHSVQLGNITGAWGTSQAKGELANGSGWYPESAGVIVHLYPTIGRGEIEHKWH